MPVNIAWPMYDTMNQTYILLDHDMGDHSTMMPLVPRAVNFWENIVPELLKIDEEPTGNGMCTSAAGRAIVAPIALLLCVLAAFQKYVT